MTNKISEFMSTLVPMVVEQSNKGSVLMIYTQDY